MFSLLVAVTLHIFAPGGAPALENWRTADMTLVWPALISGVLFNLSNTLLVMRINAAEMSVAFPVGVGLALVIGTVEIVVAMVLSATAHQRLPSNRGEAAVAWRNLLSRAGSLMACFNRS